MNFTNKKKVILGVVLLALFISIPITISQLSKQAEDRSRAAGSTTLSLSPTSTTVANNNAVNLDLYVDPGTNTVTFVRYQIMYDPAKLQPAANPVTLNTAVFTSIEGPVTTSGTLAQSVSIGSDPTKAVIQKTKIATLHFTAVGTTNGTNLTFGSISQALSSSANNQANENVLSTTIPALVIVTGNSSSNPTATPTTKPTTQPTKPAATPTLAGNPTDTPAPTFVPVPTDVPSPVPTVTGTALSFTLLLDGVGSAGDNPNPTGSSLSNKTPVHTQRTLDVQLYNTSNQLAANSSGVVVYDESTGTFVGDVGFPSSLTAGNYLVKVQTDRYLRRRAPVVVQVISGQKVNVPTTQLITGDVNKDNVLNVLDYNALLDCGYGDLDPSPMNDPGATFNSSACQVHTPADNVDLNDDGIINSTDYNLFLRELSVQNGD